MRALVLQGYLVAVMTFLWRYDFEENDFLQLLIAS